MLIILFSSFFFRENALENNTLIQFCRLNKLQLPEQTTLFNLIYFTRVCTCPVVLEYKAN